MAKKKKYNNPFQAIIQGVGDLAKKRPRIKGLEKSDRLEGKTVLITGASSGLGYSTAIELAERGANLIMAVRSGIPEKGNNIRKLTNSKDVSMRYIDLSDFDSIDAFISGLESDSIKIDIFISNAAVVCLKSRKTKQGLDEMFMVNYLSVFYLTNKLINKSIIRTNKSRIIFVASESHRNPKEFDLSNFGVYRDFGFNETVSIYGINKMFLISFAIALQNRVPNYFVRALCPGPVNTNIAREAPSLLKPMLKGIFGVFFRSPETAREPVVFFSAESSPKDGFDYLFLMSKVETDEKVRNEKNAKLLWTKSEELIHNLSRSIH